MKHSFSGTARLLGAGSHPQRRRSVRNSLFLICELRSCSGLVVHRLPGLYSYSPPPNLTSTTDLKEAYFIPPYNYKYFLETFAKFLKATISFAMSVRQSVCPYEPSFHWTNFEGNLTFARFAENISKQFKFR
jgi:hypothetical protein